MQIHFDGAGFKAEQLCAIQFNGELTNLKEHQYKDIDVFIKSKTGELKSCSVKDQLWSSGKFGGIQIETKLINTDNGKEQQGCFYTNQSDYYFWRITTAEYGDTWLVVQSSVLKGFVEANKHRLKAWATRPATEEKNRSYGRFYNRTEGLVIPVSEAITLGKLIPVKETKH